MLYKLKPTDFEHWVSASDDHQDAPGIEKGPSADAEAAAPQPAKYDKEGDQS